MALAPFLHQFDFFLTVKEVLKALVHSLILSVHHKSVSVNLVCPSVYRKEESFVAAVFVEIICSRGVLSLSKQSAQLVLLDI